jgi:hypothetical protein
MGISGSWRCILGQSRPQRGGSVGFAARCSLTVEEMLVTEMRLELKLV